MWATCLSLSPALACIGLPFFAYTGGIFLRGDSFPPPRLQCRENLVISANVAEIDMRRQPER